MKSAWSGMTFVWKHISLINPSSTAHRRQTFTHARTAMIWWWRKKATGGSGFPKRRPARAKRRSGATHGCKPRALYPFIRQRGNDPAWYQAEQLVGERTSAPLASTRTHTRTLARAHTHTHKRTRTHTHTPVDMQAVESQKGGAAVFW